MRPAVLQQFVCLLDSSAARDLSSCSCPPRCTNVGYKATLSSSRLSNTMKNHYLSYGSNESATGRRYMNAVETRSRVASPLLSDVIGHLEKLTTAYQRLKAVLAVDLIDHSTSVPGQIYASINTIVEQTQRSLEQFGSQIVDKFTERYVQNAEFLFTKAITSAKSIILRYQLYVKNMDADDVTGLHIRHTKELFSLGDALCDDMEGMGNLFGENFLTAIFGRSCSNDIMEYCRHASSIVITQNATSYPEELPVFKIFQHMMVSAKAAVRCLPIYGTFLKEVQSWLKLALTINSSLPLRPGNYRSFLMDLEDDLNWLTTFSHTFSAKSMVSCLSIMVYRVKSCCTSELMPRDTPDANDVN